MAPAIHPATIGLGSSLLLLVLAVGAAYTWRGQIVAEWPPSAHAYALFGLQPQTETSQ